MLDLKSLEQTLGFTFKKSDLLKEALTHTSSVNENTGLNPSSNERLEFLGDSVLGLIISQRLFDLHPDFNEGDLTQLRANLIRRETLARIAKSLDLGAYLSLGKGEEAGGGRVKIANLAGALEALIGAIYLDRGFGFTKTSILKLFEAEIYQQNIQADEIDYKSKLQEFVQFRGYKPPVYSVLAASGPDHDKTFTVEATVDELVTGVGLGKSKKAAEMSAAKAALEKLSQ